MTIRWEEKRPNEVRDYHHDWSAFLDGDLIASSDWDVAGAIKGADDKTSDGVTIWLSGGTDGTVARLTNTITTAGGRTESETFTVLIREADEPVTIAEARRQLRVDSDADDQPIWDNIVAAREWVEDHTGLILVRRPVTERLPRLDDRSTLRAWPVSADDPVTVSYLDHAGAEQVIGNSTIRAPARPARLLPAAGSRWPYPGAINGAVDVTFTAGFATGAEVPASLKQAMLVLITAYYENRAGEDLEAAELAAARLCRGGRRHRL